MFLENTICLLRIQALFVLLRNSPVQIKLDAENEQFSAIQRRAEIFEVKTSLLIFWSFRSYMD
jgi:hypothetical protein